MSFSMKTTVFGIKKKFPSVNNISCQELEKWRREKKNLICLVKSLYVVVFRIVIYATV